MQDFLWTEKYRPKTVEDLVLPESLKKRFQEFVEQKNIPNLILSGSAGTGKTSVAKAMCEMLGCDYIVINGSLNGNIDTLRTDISRFASSVSLMGGRKYVILDEADYLTNATQPALRNFMEEFSKNCGFILTCNFKDKIIEPLRSRCSVIDFKYNKTDIPALAAKFFKRVCMILQTEKIEFDKPVLAEVVTKHFPDQRRILNELQSYSATGKIDSGILTNTIDGNLSKLITSMKEKSFSEMRKWVAESDIDGVEFFRLFFDKSEENLKKESIPQLVLILAKYQYQHSFVANPDINLIACIVEIAADCDFK